MQAKFGTQVYVWEGTVGSYLDEMVIEGVEWGDEIRVISLKVIKLGDVYQKVVLYIFVLGGPDLFSLFIDDGILMWVVIGSGAGRGSEEVWEELGFQEDRERKDAVGRSRWSRRRDSGNGGNNDRWWKVLDWDVSEGDVLNYFLKTLMDICVLQLGV